MESTTTALDLASVINGLKDSFAEIATSIGTVIVDLLPIVLPIMGATVIISFGVRLFKKLSGRA